MKRFHKILAALFCGLFLFFLIFIPTTSQARFTKLCDSIFREELAVNSLTLHYVLKNPEQYGVDCSEITLGTEESAFSDKMRLLKNFLSLQTIARGSLSGEDKKTYDMLHYSLSVRLDSFRFETLREPLVPSIGIQSQLPVLLAEYTFRNEQDVDNYLKLLSCVPQYFDSILDVEKKKLKANTFMDSETAAELLAYCRQFSSQKDDHFLAKTFRERLEGLKIPTAQKALYIEENASILKKDVFPAYEKLALFLEKYQEAGTQRGGLSDYPDGADYYRWLLRSEIGTDSDFEEIGQKLEKALLKDARTIARLLKTHPELLREKERVSLDTSDPTALTSYLAKRTAKDFPDVENAGLKICAVPKSMEKHLSPAFYLVPPIDAWQNNVVYLNHGSLTNGLSFFTTLAHETYPGHLYQTVYENSRNPHPVRRLLYFGGYTEGWATYAEQLSYFYAPISAELAALLSATRAMTLNLYSHLDLYIHAYGWTEEDCRAYLKPFGITSSAAVHDIFMLVKQQPANYLKYYLGYLEICELKEQAQKTLGDSFRLKDFHEFILSCAPMPFTLLEEQFEEWLREETSV